MLKPALAAHFESYAASHRHPTNRLTHKIAIPLIVFHIVAMLDWVKFMTFEGTPFSLSLAVPIYVVAVAWYLSLNVKLGILMAILYGVCFPIGWYTPWQAVVGVAVFGWLVQLAGHSIWEKNRPAFLTNLLQALIGPLFFAAVLTGDWPQKSVAARAESAG